MRIFLYPDMGLFDFITGKRSVAPVVNQVSSLETPPEGARAFTLTDYKQWETILNPLGEKINVTRDTALRLSPWYACISAKAKDIAALPTHVYRRSGTSKEVAFDSDQYFLMKSEPNSETTMFEFKYRMLCWKYQWGDGVARIERNPRSGRPIAYHLRDPWELVAYRDGGNKRSDLYYKDYLANEIVDPYDVIHLKNGVGFGDSGVSMITMASNSLKQGLAADKFLGKFYEQGTHVSGWVEFPGWFKPGEASKFRDEVKEDVSGIDNSGELLILQGGGKYHQLGIKLADLEFIASRNFTNEEVCRWMDVPPSRIHVKSAAASTYEDEMLRYKTFSILPELVQFEQEFDRKVFQFIEDGALYLKNEIKGFMRGDTKAQTEFYKTGSFYGFLTKDEIREYEDLNPLPDGIGARTFTQSSMIPDDKINDYVDAVIAGKVKTIQSDKSEEQKKSINGSSHDIGAPAGEFTAGVRPN